MASFVRNGFSDDVDAVIVLCEGKTDIVAI